MSVPPLYEQRQPILAELSNLLREKPPIVREPRFKRRPCLAGMRRGPPCQWMIA
jgi:hypothetical protein